MGLAKKAMVLFWMMAVCEVSMGSVYKVGDSAGWTTVGNVDYNKWASTKNFLVGDIIIFEYHKQFHNVMQVSRSDFHSCNATAPIATYSTGNDSITIRWPGHYFFICGFPGHCLAEQKVDIRVLRASHPSASPSVSPSAAPYESEPAASPIGLITPNPSENSAPSLLSSNWSLSSKFGLSIVIVLASYISGFVY
ncbi:unnamed protein product [Ilex paraguariensis]|uniref:Phytocyanin domain-containing protein n=1 Tax=Ilex paraguariensis TaxID=185542 RepID=A0ABC8RYF3_9AQUA